MKPVQLESLISKMINGSTEYIKLIVSSSVKASREMRVWEKKLSAEAGSQLKKFLALMLQMKFRKKRVFFSLTWHGHGIGTLSIVVKGSATYVNSI